MKGRKTFNGKVEYNREKGDIDKGKCQRIERDRSSRIGVIKLFCKYLKSKYFRLCGPDGFCYLIMPLQDEVSHIQWVKEWTWLCFITTLFIKRDRNS